MPHRAYCQSAAADVEAKAKTTLTNAVRILVPRKCRQASIVAAEQRKAPGAIDQCGWREKFSPTCAAEQKRTNALLEQRSPEGR